MFPQTSPHWYSVNGCSVTHCVCVLGSRDGIMVDGHPVWKSLQWVFKSWSSWIADHPASSGYIIQGSSSLAWWASSWFMTCICQNMGGIDPYGSMRIPQSNCLIPDLMFAVDCIHLYTWWYSPSIVHCVPLILYSHINHMTWSSSIAPPKIM